MSRTRKGGKAPGYDYWSRRPASGRGYGPDVKRQCHGIERAQAKDAVRGGLGEAWLPGGPYPAADQDEYDAAEAAEIDRLYAGLDD